VGQTSCINEQGEVANKLNHLMRGSGEQVVLLNKRKQGQQAVKVLTTETANSETTKSHQT